MIWNSVSTHCDFRWFLKLLLLFWAAVAVTSLERNPDFTFYDDPGEFIPLDFEPVIRPQRGYNKRSVVLSPVSEPKLSTKDESSYVLINSMKSSGQQSKVVRRRKRQISLGRDQDVKTPRIENSKI